MYQKHLKRPLDVLGACLALIAAAPALLLIAVTVRIRLGSPVFFAQSRPGLHGRPFRIVKFRTMRDARDANGLKLPDAARLTRFGSFLRSTSLDELPEFWNVVKGEMSLVGPRPLLVEYLDRYTPAQACRHDVRPGITGLAQVSGRNAITWNEKFALDLEYVERCSLAARGESLALHRDGRGASRARRDDREYREYLREEQRSPRGCIARRMQPDSHHGLLWLDVRIFLLTISQVLTRRGVNRPGHVTTEEFAGSA